QQANRMRLAVEDIGEMVARAGTAARIAGRCSVFAKSDMIHAQQKGCSPEEILKGLCEAVARNFKSSINKGKDPVPRVALVGGLFANQGVALAVRNVFGFSPDDVVLPWGFAHLGAVGAAMLAAEDAASAGKPQGEALVLSANAPGRGSGRSPPGPPSPPKMSCS
ncbi:MAG: CoA protein activase, partial [Deltaproteobacteria bacterium]|nr:CoA protein activase [Deltaproteobacteria bacterium]